MTPSEYWRANLRLVCILLTIWAIPPFVLSIFFVEQLNTIKMGGFPLGFWFSQQGSIYIFIVLVLVYAVMMDKLDTKYLSSQKGDANSKEGGAA